MILLTGGTGFVGRNLVMQLVADARRVRVLSRTPGRVPFPELVSWARGDLTNAASLTTALQDVRTVIHAAATVSGGANPADALEQVNVAGTVALARAARNAGVGQFVHISSAGVYGDGSSETPHRENDTPAPTTLYERSKLSSELALATTLEGSEVLWTILRPQGLYGPDRPATADFFRNVARRRLWVHGPSRVLLQPTHIADLTSAVIHAVDHQALHCEVINIGGARALEFRELIVMVGARMGHTPIQFSAPRAMSRLAAAVARAWESIGRPPARLRRVASTWINRAVNIEKARRLLGYEPVSLEWGLDQTAAEVLRNGRRTLVSA